MYKSYYISIFVFLLSSVSGFCQSEEPDTSRVITSYKLNSSTMIPYETPYDSGFESIFDYNIIEYQSFSNTFLGNTGQAALTNDFYMREHNSPFFFVDPLKMYYYNPYNIFHYNTRLPFTEVKYLSSGNRDNSEQVLSAMHTQNVNEFVNIGLFYDLIASKGMYSDQNVSTNRINLFGSYNKDNYSFYSSFHYNGHKSQENGGLQDISSFVSQSSDGLYRMLLEDANSRVKNINFLFTQKLNLSTLAKDSLSETRLDNFGFYHTLNIERYNRTYFDNISEIDSLNYYEDQFYLVNDVVDSAFYQNLSNRFDLSVKMIGESQEFRVYMKHEFKTFSFIKPANLIYELEGEPTDTVIEIYSKEHFNDISVGGQFIGQLKTWNYTLDGQLYLTGYSIGDIYTEANFEKKIGARDKLQLNAKLSSYKPSYFLNNYGSEHFVWNNDFKKTESTKIALSYSRDEKVVARASFSLFNDYVYLNDLAMPALLDQELMVANIFVNKTFIWGPFRNKHELLLQKSSSDIVHLPLVAYKNRSWFQGALFNKVLGFQIGGEVYYFTEYYGDAFMAATGIFYNQTDQKIGNYPFVKGFLNVKIKRTRFTLQYTNALSSLVDANYFMAYRYPNFNGSLKFGLAWTFYD